MNPHFIFNSLNTVQHLILTKDEQQSLDFLADFSVLMRTMLENSRKPYITLSDEIGFLNRYMQLERIRFNNKFKFIVSVEEALLAEEIKIPPALLQPLLENAIKHGITATDGTGIIKLNILAKNDVLVVTIDDNGIGINKHRADTRPLEKNRASTALKVVEERLKLFRNNGGESSMTITDKSIANHGLQGTLIELSIPIHK